MKSICSITIPTLILLATLLTSGCAPMRGTKAEEFPQVYTEMPRSILVLPPINESTDTEAKDYYMTTIEKPLALAGYYVFPVEMINDIMKQEGVYDTELLSDTPAHKFNEYFGADAVLFTRIKEWDVSYVIISSSLTVSVEAELISTKTSEQLWEYEDKVTVDLGGQNGSSSGNLIADLVVAAVSSAINTAMADYVDYARIVTERLINTLPVGPYHEMYLKDQGTHVSLHKAPTFEDFFVPH